MSVLCALLETACVIAVFVLLQLLSRTLMGDTAPTAPPQQTSTWLTTTVYASLRSVPPRQLLFPSLVLVGLVYTLKNVITSYSFFLRDRLVFRSVSVVTNNLLKTYLSAPFSFHLQRRAADLIQRVTQSCAAAFHEVLNPVVTILADLLVLLCLVAVFLVSVPFNTLAATLILLSGFALLVRFSRARALAWGERAWHLEIDRLASMQQSLNCIQEISVTGRRGHFADQFGRLEDEMGELKAKRSTLWSVSYLLVETGFVFTFLSLTAMTLATSSTVVLLPLMGLYTYAAFRMIPSVGRILVNIGLVRHSAPAVEAVHHDLSEHPEGPRQVEVEPLPISKTIEFKGVSYQYPGVSSLALEKVDFRVEAGQTVAILGPNGSGKTTLVLLLLGLLSPSQGSVAVDGQDLAEQRVEGWQRNLGYVPQQVRLLNDTLRRNVALGLADQEIDDQRVTRALEQAQFQLSDLPEGLATHLGEGRHGLSGGQKQKIGLARALYEDPQVLVLDEPTASLDAEAEEEVDRLLSQLRGQRTVFVVTHQLEAVGDYDRKLSLRHGRLTDARKTETR